ncbi:RDD family protein [Pontimicrobium sp. IMCC45349]|uniref:RDD family protein n=1 Tax=Pontimicrobium sp. IMCC45349 TaxID=3391574 RepID=UPI0039A3E703
MKFAAIKDRIQAAIIDSIIIIIAIFLVSELFTQFESVSKLVKIIAFLIIFILYDPLLTSINGGTIGHSLSKITVRKEGDLNKNISFPLAVIRFILKALLGWVSLITISGNEKKKAIHDFVANSVVIKRT